MATAAIDTFTPTVAVGFPARAVFSLLIWGIVGLVVAVRFFSFEPAAPGERRTRGVQSSTEIET